MGMILISRGCYEHEMRERANTQPRGKHSAQCLVHSGTAKTTFAVGLPQNCPLVYNNILPLCKVGHIWQGTNRKIEISQTGIVSHWSERFFLDQISISMLSCCYIGASFLSKSTLFLIWICLLIPIEFSQELLATHCETLVQLSLSLIPLVLLTHTVVTDATMGGPGRPEDLACITVFQFHNLVVYLEIFNTRRWSLALWHRTIGGFCKSVKRNLIHCSPLFESKVSAPLQKLQRPWKANAPLSHASATRLEFQHHTASPTCLLNVIQFLHVMYM